MDRGEGQLLDAAALRVGDRVAMWRIEHVGEAGVVEDEADAPLMRWQMRAGWSPLR